MKNSIRILLVFLISTSTSFACGWYPFGEDVRFSLINPALFDDGGMSPYYYTSENYGYSFQATPENDPNIALWMKYCDYKVDAKSIYEAIYELDEKSINVGKSDNKMISYLMEKDKEALEYIAFAKSCSHLNNGYSGWEDDSEAKSSSRNEKMAEALKRSNRIHSESIKKRYQFLAVRLAFYEGSRDKVRSIYEKSFSGNPQDAIDYWALYFNTTTEEKSAKRNYNLAQVFVNAPGKRFGALSHFSSKIPMDEVLKFASTNTERANIYATYAVRNRGRGLPTLKKVQELDPNNPLLDYLLIRELNKIEDWILTPRYTNFEPTMDLRRQSYSESEELIQERIEDDKKYCHELLNWMGSVNPKSVQNWNIAEAYLKGITGNEMQAIVMLGDSNKYPIQMRGLLKKLLVLFKVRAHSGRPFNSEEHAVLMDSEQDNYNMFLFAVSREYEFQRRMAVAAGLFSQVNKTTDYFSEGVSWKSGTGKATLESDYFYSWFLYLDAEYTSEELQSVIDFAQTEFDKSSKFDHWQRENLLAEIDKLYDLLGTKYIRSNNINAAISAFEKVGGDLWSEYPYITYLDANPFHADFYSGHKPSEFDTVKYTKLKIAKLYKSYLAKAENPRTENRAYYYFLVANCELNMSHYGNSWMMRRYFWTMGMHPNYLEDDDEFFRVKRARGFYQKASDVSSSREVKALCLRMSGRCEKHQLVFDAPDSWDFDYDSHGGYVNYFYSKNKSYKKLKENYPNHEKELMSNCFSFERYFAKLEN